LGGEIMPKDVSNEYYRIPEEELQEKILNAKSGNEVAQLSLLDDFKPFLDKWVALLYHGKYNLNNYDVKQFVALFVGDKKLQTYLKRGQLNAGGYKQIQEIMSPIKGMVQRYGDEEDIRQTVNMTFFQCIRRYERRESKQGGWVPFSGFLYRYFFFMLKKDVDAFLIYQLGRKTFPLITDEDYSGEDDDGEKMPGYHAPVEMSAEELIGPEEIDEYWVAGDSALYPFDILSVQERQLLKWRFVDGYRSSEIAQRITEHPNTVRGHYNRIKEKIQQVIKEDIE
jgi:hypothetical protein